MDDILFTQGLAWIIATVSTYTQVVDTTLNRFKVPDQTSLERQRITRAPVYYTT